MVVSRVDVESKNRIWRSDFFGFRGALHSNSSGLLRCTFAPTNHRHNNYGYCYPHTPPCTNCRTSATRVNITVPLSLDYPADDSSQPLTTSRAATRRRSTTACAISRVRKPRNAASVFNGYVPCSIGSCVAGCGARRPLRTLARRK